MALIIGSAGHPYTRVYFGDTQPHPALSPA